MEVVVTALIQAVSQAFQAATATPVISAAMDTTETGGLLQIPVPTHGILYWATTTTMSAGTAKIGAAAILLVASGIRDLSDAVALC